MEIIDCVANYPKNDLVNKFFIIYTILNQISSVQSAKTVFLIDILGHSRRLFSLILYTAILFYNVILICIF